MTRVLVSNDDGVDSPGVIELARVARAAGYDVLVAAPLHQSSGSAAGLWFDRSARPPVTSREVPGLDAPVLAVAAHPGMIALLAMTGQLGPIPDLVLSGINDASNLGSGVLHSGTAGAAIVGAAHGAAAAAVSLYCDEIPDSDPRRWATAGAVVAGILDDIAGSRGTAVNINVPNVEELSKPLVRARWQPDGCVPSLLPFLAAFHVANGTEMTAPDLRRPPGSDLDLVPAGYPTVSTLPIGGGARETPAWLDRLPDLSLTSTIKETPWPAQ